MRTRKLGLSGNSCDWLAVFAVKVPIACEPSAGCCGVHALGLAGQVDGDPSAPPAIPHSIAMALPYLEIPRYQLLKPCCTIP